MDALADAPYADYRVDGNALTYQIQSYLEAGMDAVVTKPIDVADLFGTIDQVLSGASNSSVPTGP